MRNHIQKVGAALVLLLFLLSIVPVALADIGVEVGVNLEAEAGAEVSGDSAEAGIDSKVNGEVQADSNKDNNSDLEEDDEEDDDEKEEKEASQDKPEELDDKPEDKRRMINIQKEIRAKANVNAKDILKRNLERKEDLRDMAGRRLVEAKVKLQETREDYLKIKEKYRLAVEEHKEQREKVRELDDKAKRCRNGDSEECKEIRLELKLGVALHLEKTINVVDRSLEKLKNRVEEIKDLSDEDKENALELIADVEAELDAVKEKVKSFDENTSREEVRTAIKELKDIAQKVRVLQKRIVSLLINAKLSVLVEKHAEFRNGMELRIKTLADLGVDVSELEEILAEFDEKVEELEADYQAAQQKWKDSNNERFDLFVKEVREAQNKVRKDLQETKKILRDFIKVYKELKNPPEVEEPEEEQEDEEDELKLEISIDGAE